MQQEPRDSSVHPVASSKWAKERRTKGKWILDIGMYYAHAPRACAAAQIARDEVEEEEEEESWHGVAAAAFIDLHVREKTLGGFWRENLYDTPRESVCELQET